ncbi:MAG TPA: MarR family transcriptional regulator [Betaproteobacteria bacterium]|nr:MarR family transcriptional regulator [Betaproteobacteria bacterium]
MDPGHAAENHGQPAAAARYDLRILRAMRQMIHYVDLYSKQLASAHRITAPQLVCLLTVVEKSPTTATAIGREIQLSASTVVGILDRLEEKGLITRERDRIDRRLVYIRATALGAALAQNAPSPLQATLANMLGTLPEKEQATIARSLERIAGLMAAQRLDAAPSVASSSRPVSTIK